MLYLIATPIGHLDDLSHRALAVLRSVDLLLCEDTRRSSILLERYGIEKPLLPFHQFNEKQEQNQILEQLRSGREIGLISDAGTPCINDPGLRLVQACIEANVPFTALPGPCSPIQALVLSGFDPQPFQYVGFFPRKGEKEIRKILNYPGTTVALESPERLVESLREIEKKDPLRRVAVAREMTKKFEECIRGTAEEVRSAFEARPARGEIVLVIERGNRVDSEMPLDELLISLQENLGLTLKEAIKIAAKLKDLPKSEVYKQAHKNEPGAKLSNH